MTIVPVSAGTSDGMTSRELKTMLSVLTNAESEADTKVTSSKVIEIVKLPAATSDDAKHSTMSDDT